MKEPASPAEIETVCTLYGYCVIEDLPKGLPFGSQIRRLRDGETFWIPIAWSVDDWIAALRKS